MKNFAQPRRYLTILAAITWTVAVAAAFSGCGDSVSDEVQSATSDAQLGDTLPGDLIGGDQATADTTPQDGTGDTGLDIALDAGTDIAADKTAPTIAFVQPLPGFTIGLGDDLAVELKVNDETTAADKLQVVVKAGSKEVCKGLAQPSGKFTCVVKDLPAGPLLLGGQVNDESDNQANADVNGLVNTAPGAPQVAITPEKPLTTDALVATITASAPDPDRKPGDLTYAWLWLKDGAPTQYKTAELPALVAKKGEIWTAQATSADPFATGKSGSASVVIGNSAPQAAELALAPTAIDVTSAATCGLAKAATDADGDALVETFAWLVNDVALPGAASATLDLQTAKTAAGALLQAGDKLRCTLASSDGTAVALASSATATIAAAEVCALIKPCAPTANCTDNGTMAPKCECLPGYSGDGKTCADIDECLLGTGGCDLNADCTNTVGSNTCACKPGYSGDGKTCGDVNECLTNNGGCDLNADCSNTVGSSSCACKSGYAGDGKTCTDIDECLQDNGGCASTALCTNTPGANTCSCKPGYSGDGKTCADIDECLKDNGGCHANATCANTVGGNTCACKTGYSGDGKSCTDVDECLTNNGGCDANAQCSNTPGSNTCACKPGYSGDGKTCADIDECLTNNGGCAATATCANSPGSNTCTCKPGYSGDGKTCADIDECLKDNGGCNGYATCTNTLGGHTCACKPGFMGDGKTCTDIDECQVDNGGCHGFATCLNIPGSNTCACKPGYSGNGKVCGDIDECLKDNGGCDLNADCTNTLGSNECACKDGFSGDGKTCTDIDECSLSLDATALVIADGLQGWTVKNSDSKVGWGAKNGEIYYANAALTGYNTGLSNKGTATSPQWQVPATVPMMLALDITLAVEEEPDYDLFSIELSSGSTPVVAFKKPMPLPKTLHLEIPLTAFGGQQIQVTFKFDTVDSLYNDTAGIRISNMKLLPMPCHAQATCTNGVGNYTCECNSGYQGNGQACTDIDECATKNGGCDANATCTNTPGSSSCECKPYWQGDGKKCKDVDECATNNGGCGANTAYKCINNEGSPPSCSDLNECVTGSAVCDPNATCGNTDGSYTCTCKTGFLGNGKTCTAAPGTAANPAKDCKAILSAVAGSPSAVYWLDPDGVGGANAFQTHCEMTASYGSIAGGWNLAMKVDGNKQTFVYSAAAWTNATLVNANLPAYDSNEAKLQTFVSVPVSQILVRLVIDGTARDLVLPIGAGKTLLQLFQGAEVASAVGRNAWKGLVGPKASLQPYCSMEGLNRVCGGDTAVRIGIVANQENDCGSCDSRIGVGATGTYCGQDANNSAGNEARCSPDNGDLSLRGFAYVYVR